MKNPIRLNALAIGLGGIGLLLAQAAAAQEFVPTRMSYQGRVTAGGTNFNGTGWFKFALVNQYGDTAYWSNDGSSMGGEEPAAPVEIAVADGLFTAMLGDTSNPNMVEMLPEILDWSNDAHLRIWFSEDGLVFEQLSPDQPAGSTLYALLAARVPPGAISNAHLASGAVTVSKIANLSVTGAKIENSTITSNKIDWSTMPALSLNGYAESGSFSLKPVAARADSIAMGSGCIASGNYAVVSGGQRNQALAAWATVGGGDGNKATNTYATVGGGQLNEAYGTHSTVGGGNQNDAEGTTAAVLGGYYNHADGAYSAVGGGQENWASGSNAVVSGGRDNWASDHYTSIGGGEEHLCSDYGARVGGGSINTASSTNAVVAGGMKNTASGPYSSVGGGQSNTASALAATVAGGVRNTADNPGATISGGQANRASGTNSVVAGGRWNWARSNYATVGGGYTNTANGEGATVAGGAFNTASRFYATVGGGRQNTASALTATVAGGDGNTASGEHSTVGGGYFNRAYQNRSTIGGGEENTANGDHATIPGGRFCFATNAGFAAGMRARAVHEGAFVWGDSTDASISSTTGNQVLFRCNGGVRFQDTSGAQFARWFPGEAAWTISSDRELKEGFVPVDPQEVLAKVAALPISEWNYKGYEQRHVGPMAQDFHAAFPLAGSSDIAINSLHLDGVALAAIQGLYQENQELKARIDRLEALIAGTEP
ncbi:MAG: hypothetical protein EOM72_05885 [Opitutae bacterium]|nr:hypothetical protein [Opitutae bacterium]